MRLNNPKQDKTNKGAGQTRWLKRMAFSFHTGQKWNKMKGMGNDDDDNEGNHMMIMIMTMMMMMMVMTDNDDATTTVRKNDITTQRTQGGRLAVSGKLSGVEAKHKQDESVENKQAEVV